MQGTPITMDIRHTFVVDWDRRVILHRSAQNLEEALEEEEDRRQPRRGNHVHGGVGREAVDQRSFGGACGLWSNSWSHCWGNQCGRYTGADGEDDEYGWQQCAQDVEDGHAEGFRERSDNWHDREPEMTGWNWKHPATEAGGGVFHATEPFDKHDWDTTESANRIALWAAQRLAVLFGETGQRGFEVFSRCGGRGAQHAPFRPADIESEVLARLCLVANTNRVPVRWREAAAFAGGIAPRPDLGFYATPGWERCAVPGNENCEALVARLLDRTERPPLPAWCESGEQLLFQMKAKNRGDVVECALAAADCALAAEQHLATPGIYPNWARNFRDVEGGGHGKGDEVTEWIQQQLHDMLQRG